MTPRKTFVWILTPTILILLTTVSSFSQTRGMTDWVREGIADRKICICGSVGNPSDLQINGSLTLARAIENAGGFLPGAKKVVIMRWNPGSSLITPIRVRLRDVQEGKKSDLWLQPADAIFVIGAKRRDRDPKSRPCFSVPML